MTNTCMYPIPYTLYPCTCPQAMTNTCKFAHNSAQLRKLKYGENLYMTSGSLKWSSVVSAWTSEVKYYNFKKPGFSSATGHFTQVCNRLQTLYVQP